MDHDVNEDTLVKAELLKPAIVHEPFGELSKLAHLVTFDTKPEGPTPLASSALKVAVKGVLPELSAVVPVESITVPV